MASWRCFRVGIGVMHKLTTSKKLQSQFMMEVQTEFVAFCKNSGNLLPQRLISDSIVGVKYLTLICI